MNVLLREMFFVAAVSVSIAYAVGQLAIGRLELGVGLLAFGLSFLLSGAIGKYHELLSHINKDGRR